MLAVGFESGSDETLKKIKKGTTVEDNLLAAKMIKEVGIPLFGFFMIGFPWETKELIGKTESLIHKIDPDFIELHIAMPFYGTELYKQCKAYGVLNDSGFGHDYYAPNTVGTAYIDIKEIQRMKERILIGFYLRPKYLLRRSLDAFKKPVVLKNYILFGIKMLKNNNLKRVKKN